MNNWVIKEFNLDFLDESVDLYMKTYSHEPWNESWESRDIVVNFFKNHFLNNYFLGYVIFVDDRVAGVSLGF